MPVMRNIWGVRIVQSAENYGRRVKYLTFFAELRYNRNNQTRLRRKAEDMSYESAHLTERMLTR